MGKLNFTIKELRHARDMSPGELPPIVGKGRILVGYDEMMAGIPLQKEEDPETRTIRPEAPKEK